MGVQQRARGGEGVYATEKNTKEAPSKARMREVVGPGRRPKQHVVKTDALASINDR